MNGIRVLIVEDEILIAKMMEMWLSFSGYMVTGIAATAEDAIAAAAAFRPHAVLMDIKLAGESDGIQAAEAIRRESNCQIIFISGYANPENRRRADGLNPLGFFDKPVDLERLGSVLGQMSG